MLNVSCFLGNVCFKHPNVAGGRAGVGVKITTDLVLIKRDKLKYVSDVETMRGLGQHISDTLQYYIKLVGGHR